MKRWIAGVLLGMLATPGMAVAQRPVVYRVPVSGIIENGLAPYIARVIAIAETAGAAGVILDIDTPGGRIDAAERIADVIGRSTVPVTAWVHPRAYSAGALIALAAKNIYMAPAGVIGAATPVDGAGTKASEKMVSAMRAEFRSLAEAQGRDPKLAEAMVDEGIDVALAPTGKLLTMSTVEAIDVGFAEGEANSIEVVLEAIGLPDAEVRFVDLTWAESVVRFLSNPIVSPLLLSLGMLGLIFEIKSGAFGMGGLISLLSLGLFFGSSFLLGLAGWEEVILLALGFIALAVEIFLIPGFGVAGILGICFLGGATVLALLGATPSGADLVNAFSILGVSLVVTAAVFFTWLRHLPNSHRFSGLLLQGGVARGEGYISAPQRDDLVGESGTTLTDLRPSGTAVIAGDRMDVVTEGEFIPAGATVTVIRAEGYRHIVRLAPDAPHTLSETSAVHE